VITRNFGYTWDLSGFLVTEFLKKIGAHNVERLRHRVRDGLTTTFASHYTARVPLDEVLTREAALRYTALRTGEKYLILPAE